MPLSGGNSNSKPVILNDPAIMLRRYRSIPVATARKIAWVGDSTTETIFSGAVGGFTNVLVSDNLTGYGSQFNNGPFKNVTHGNFGANGAALSVYLADGAGAGKNLSDIVSFAPDLIVFCYGINGVRLGLTTKAQLKERIRTAVAQYQSQLPETDIILRTPNSLLYDAANTSSYIDAPVTLAKVQSYTDILRESYTELIGEFDNTYVLNLQDGEHNIFSKTSFTLANKGYYFVNALHPNGEGLAAVIREVISVIYPNFEATLPLYSTQLKPAVSKFSKARAYNATNISSTNDYLYYPRVCEDDSKYNLILDGVMGVYSVGSYMRVYANEGVTAVNYSEIVKQNDIIVQYGTTDTTSGSQGELIDEDGVVAWKHTGASPVDISTQIQMVPPAGYPHTMTTLPVRIYRPRPATQKRPYDPYFAVVLSQADFTAGTLIHVVQRFGVAPSLVGISATAVTTGGTVDIQKNGVTFATLTWADGATVPTYSGTFFTANTRGTFFDEGDIITAVINSGFVGGTFPKITLSKN